MSKFFEELKRRNVIKATIAYLVVAWIIIQVATAVLPTFGAKDWVIQAIIIVLAIGLPIWIIVSWIYDITPEGIAKTPKESEKQIYKNLINKKLNAFIIASLSIAVVVMGLKLSGVFEEPNDNYAIAVLPFVNMSDDTEQEYFSDGISEEIINMLAQVPKLKVIGRTSSFAFKGKNMDLKLIGEQLNVNYLLEGSVRRSGNTLRITAKLINIADDGSQMFTEQFDRELEDVFDIQDEISANILETIKMKLLGEEKEAVFKNYTDNVEAYQLYLQGRYHVNKFTPDGFIKAIEFYDQAIALDSSYAIAYAGKSFCLTNLWDFQWLANEASIPLAIESAQKALQLDDKISESHLAVGRIQLHQEWNVRDALVKYEKAIELNPNSSEAHVQLAMCLSLYGRCEEALEHSKIAESLDPLSILNIFYSTIPIWACEESEIVLANGHKLIDLEPSFFSGHLLAGLGYLGLGRYDEAIKEFELSAQLYPGTYTLGHLGHAYGIKGETLKAKEVIEKIKSEKGFERLGSQSLAIIYLSIGELETAFSYLNRALEYREARLLWTNQSESMFPSGILQDPRFEDLYDRMGVIY